MKLTIKKISRSRPAYTFDPMTQGVSQSQVGTAMTCLEKFRLGVVLGWTPRGSSKPLIWGSAFHGMLEAGYKSLRATKKWPDRPTLIKASELSLSQEHPNPTSTVKDILEECYLESSPMIEPYRKMWGLQDDKVKWLKVEDEFCVKVADDLPPLKGKFDAVFEHPKFGVGLLETKTKSQISHNLIDYLPLDLQLAWYLTALRKCGLKPTTVWYNIIRRPGLKRGKEETAKDFQARIAEDVRVRPEHYFQRIPVTLEPSELEVAENRVKQCLWWLQSHASEFLAAPKERCLLWNSGACESKYGTCEMLPICSKQDYSNHYVREHVSPELKEAK